MKEGVLGTVPGCLFVSGLIVTVAENIIIIPICQLTEQGFIALPDALYHFVVLQAASFPGNRFLIRVRVSLHIGNAEFEKKV